MLVRVDDIELFYQESGDVDKPAIVFLHGFAQSHHTFDEVVLSLAKDFHIFAFDLTGHGCSSKPDRHRHYDLGVMIDDLHEAFQKLHLAEFALVGYSMGGRIALAYAAKYPSMLRSLILESASFGPISEEERAAFETRNEALVRRLQDNGIEAFFEHWQNLPLFETQKGLPREVKDKNQEMRLQNTVAALVNTLRGSGQQYMPDFRPYLDTFSIPVVYFVGLKDKKYRELSQSISNGYNIQIVPFETGHAVHLEAPSAYAAAIKGFLTGVSTK